MEERWWLQTEICRWQESNKLFLESSTRRELRKKWGIKMRTGKEEPADRIKPSEVCNESQGKKEGCSVECC